MNTEPQDRTLDVENYWVNLRCAKFEAFFIRVIQKKSTITNLLRCLQVT